MTASAAAIADALVVRCPLCHFDPHCGALARLGPATRADGSTAINRLIVCLSCGATGTQSTCTEWTEGKAP